MSFSVLFSDTILLFLYRSLQNKNESFEEILNVPLPVMIGYWTTIKEKITLYSSIKNQYWFYPWYHAWMWGSLNKPNFPLDGISVDYNLLLGFQSNSFTCLLGVQSLSFHKFPFRFHNQRNSNSKFDCLNFFENDIYSDCCWKWPNTYPQNTCSQLLGTNKSYFW